MPKTEQISITFQADRLQMADFFSLKLLAFSQVIVQFFLRFLSCHAVTAESFPSGAARMMGSTALPTAALGSAGGHQPPPSEDP